VGTTCKRIGGVDPHIKLSVEPYNKCSWWPADPACKPKKGDLVLAKVDLARTLRGNEDTNIYNCLKNNLPKYIWLEAGEYTPKPPKYLFLMVFTEDSLASLWDLDSYFRQCASGVFKSVSYYGTDLDLPVFVQKVDKKKPKPTEEVKITITNYGKVAGTVNLVVLDVGSSGRWRFVECKPIKIDAFQTVTYYVGLRVVDMNTQYYTVFATTVGCDAYARYSKSPNVAIISEKPITVSTKIVVSTEPEGADVYLDGVFVGKT